LNGSHTKRISAVINACLYGGVLGEDKKFLLFAKTRVALAAAVW